MSAWVGGCVGVCLGGGFLVANAQVAMYFAIKVCLTLKRE